MAAENKKLTEQNQLLSVQLLEANKKLGESQRLAEIGSWSWDIATGKVEWSDHMFSLMGYEPGGVDPTYKVSLQHVHEDDKITFEEKLNFALETKTAYYLENRIRKVDNTVRSVISRGDYILDDQGGIIRMFGTVQDVTEQTKLTESNRQLEQFAYILAHDFRSPLRTIVSCIEMLRRKLNFVVSSDVTQYLHFIETAAQDLYELVDDILTKSKVTSKNIKLQSISTQSLINSVTSSLKKDLTENNVLLSIGILPETIKVDRIKLRRVFQNLIGNAIKYRHKYRKCEIAIASEETEFKYVFTVQDNGIGIEEKYQTVIFDSFRKTMRTHDYAGIGIGLYICKNIVELHEGELWLEKSDLDGSHFCFSIPK